MAKLTEKQKRFVEEYLVDFNGTQAAIRAGYASSGARTEGARLLVNADIAAAVEQGKKELGENCGISREWLLKKQQEILDIALGLKTVCKSEKVRNFEQETIETVEQRIIDLKAANTAMNQLAKMVGEDGTNKVDITSNGNEVQSGVLIVHEVAESDDAWANAKKDDKESIQ